MSQGLTVDASLKAVVHDRLVAGGSDLAATPGEREVRSRLEELVAEAAPLLPAIRHSQLVDELVAEVTGLGPLDPYLADPEVTEVMLNGPGRAYVERRGRLEPIRLDLDGAGIRRLVERVISPLGLRLDRTSPIVDARLPDGSRLHAVIPPLAIDGPCLTIRRFAGRDIGLESFGVGELGGAFLRAAVCGGWNVVVAGGTSAGKTTLLNALSTAVPSAERIVTVEETAELRFDHPHVVRLESRPANAEGAGGVTVRDLVRAALRMRPDRIIVGEVRGGEALDMLQALNTGHDGSLTTVHANGVPEAVHRLEILALFAGIALPLHAVRAQLASSVDAIVHVARDGSGRRFVTEIAEVGAIAPDSGEAAVRTLFRADSTGLVECHERQRRFRRSGPVVGAAASAC